MQTVNNTAGHSIFSDFYQDRKIEIAAKAAAIPGFIFAQSHFLASDLQLTENAKVTSSNLLSNLSHLYCDSLCWLLLAIDVILLFFSKNEKLLAFAKWSLVGCLVVYVVFKVMGSDGGIFAQTADSISTWMGGGGN